MGDNITMNLKVRIFLYPELLKGIYYYKKKDYSTAEKIFSNLLELQGNNAYLNFRYGMALYKNKKWSNAYFYIQKAVNLAPERNSWKIQLTTAKKYAQDISKAKVSEVKKSLIKDPNNPPIILEYANSLLEIKQYWIAKFQFIKYLELVNEVECEDIYYKLGIISEIMCNYEDAINYFSKASALAPLNRNYKYRIGYSYEKLNNEVDANSYYDLVYMLSPPNDYVCRFGIGVFHAQRGLWDDALLAYQKHLAKAARDDAELYYRIGIANERLYQWLNSAKAFAKAIEYSETINAHWCFKCGQSYERATNYLKAEKYYREAVARSNDYKDYWLYRLGSVLEKLGKHKEATQIYHQSRRRQLPHAVNPKDVIKNKEEEYLSIYAEYYETLSINSKQVLIESFFGGNISCNPYAILSYMLEKNYDYTYIVIIKPDTIIPNNLKFRKNIIFINRGSDAYLRYLCTAKYLINNVSFPFYFIRKEGQFYLNTWHGTPMKTLGKDIKSPFQDHANVSRNFLHSTHIISPNRYTTNIILEKYDIKDLFNGEIAETGYPRVDLGLNITDKRKAEILNILGIEDKKPIVFYAPTWRGTSQSKDFDVNKLKKDIKELKSKNYHLIFRGHHLVESMLSKIELEVIVAEKNIDSNELLGICDVLITDYSSIIYDYITLNKHAISYIYDFDKYKEERGLYITKEEMVGDICLNISDIKKSIFYYLKSKKTSILEKDVKKYSYLDDGKATKRVVDFLFHNNKQYIFKYQKRETDIFFEGPFIPNGISRSFLNLMNSIDKKNRNITILINSSDLSQDHKRIAEFGNLPEDVSILSRIGKTPMTLEELWVKGKFEKSFKFYSDEFKSTLINIYKREARRILGSSNFNNAIHFEGYSLFWVLLFSQINANKHIIYMHNDKYKEWKGRFPYLEGVFNLYQFYDKVISVSEQTMNNNAKSLSNLFNIPLDKFEYCNNPININQILSDSEEVITMENEFTQFLGIKFINIGRMSHEKDQLKLIDAFKNVHKKHQNTRLFILGDGILKQDLIERIKKLSLDDSVFLLGQKANPFPYLKQSDAFILSSNHEGQPMVLLESLTIGTPIIATDIVGNRSILGNRYGLLVENSCVGLEFGMNTYIEKGLKKSNFNPFIYQKESMNKFYSLLEIK